MMARPSPRVILTTQIDDYNQMDILAADGIWTVLYKQRPINVRTVISQLEGLSNKYAKVTYPSPAPAAILAKKLNERFNTKDFTVVKIL
jgi:hypothetical protein